MNGIIEAMLFIGILTIFTIIEIRKNLKRNSNEVCSSKYILNKFEPDNSSPMITEMINFHKENKDLNSYNVK